jgi:hypothetical protein
MGRTYNGSLVLKEYHFRRGSIVTRPQKSKGDVQMTGSMDGSKQEYTGLKRTSTAAASKETTALCVSTPQEVCSSQPSLVFLALSSSDE